MFYLKENDERICYFEIKKVKIRKLVAYKLRLKYVPLQNCFTVIQLFILVSHFEIYVMASCYFEKKLLKKSQ